MYRFLFVSHLRRVIYYTLVICFLLSDLLYFGYLFLVK